MHLRQPHREPSPCEPKLVEPQRECAAIDRQVTQPEHRDGNKTRQPPFQRLSEVAPRSTEWLWSHRLPLGEISLCNGDPSKNKSSMILDLAARVSTGRPLPCSREAVSGGVVLLLAEDSISKTVLGRLRAARVDLDRIGIMTGDVSLPADIDQLRTALVGYNGRENLGAPIRWIR